MIPGSFEYHRPDSVASAVTLLANLGEDARPLAGGQSLIALMKTRLAAPDHLIDLSAIQALKGIRESGDDVVIGSMTSQHDLILSDLLIKYLPILRETSLAIADPQIRYKGTLGGNIANGDPGNDMPALMMALNAIYEISGPKGERQVAARAFYKSAYVTALQQNEIVTAIRVRKPAAGHGYAYEKLKRKIGDYATAAAAVILTMSSGTCTSASIALTNVADTPLWAEAAAAALVGSKLGAADIAKSRAAAEAITSPASDMRGPAEYRTKMAGLMLVRALTRAQSRTEG